MRRPVFPVLLVVAALALGSPAAAAETGVVLMHGKLGQSSGNSPLGLLATKLEGAGFLVAAPDMPWSRSRRFDRTFDDAMAEIDGLVGELKSRGAAKIVVGGHSLGAAAALGYGARRDGLAGILAIAPGHTVDIAGFQRLVDHDYRRAREMIAAGRGGETAVFKDVNQSRQSTVPMTAEIYASWFDPDGPAVMSQNAANLKPGTPLMWIYGEKDRLMVRRGRAYAFERAPGHPLNAYVVVKGGHRATPKTGARDIIEWLKGL